MLPFNKGILEFPFTFVHTTPSDVRWSDANIYFPAGAKKLVISLTCTDRNTPNYKLYQNNSIVDQTNGVSFDNREITLNPAYSSSIWLQPGYFGYTATMTGTLYF